VTGPVEPLTASELDDSLLLPWPVAEEFRYHLSHVWLDQGSAEGDLMELTGWISPQMRCPPYLRYYRTGRRAPVADGSGPGWVQSPVSLG